MGLCCCSRGREPYLDALEIIYAKSKEYSGSQENKLNAGEVKSLELED